MENNNTILLDQEELEIFKEYCEYNKIGEAEYEFDKSSNNMYAVSFGLNIAIDFYDYITTMITDDEDSFFITKSQPDDLYFSDKWMAYERLIDKLAVIKGITIENL